VRTNVSVRRVGSRAAFAAGATLYVVGGGALLTHVLSGVVNTPSTNLVNGVGTQAAEFEIALRVLDGSRTVICLTTARAYADVLVVDEHDLPKLYHDLGCKHAAAT